MTVQLRAGRATARIDGVCSSASEMRGVLELQAMLLSDLARRENQIKGFSRTELCSQSWDLKRFRVDTAEALEKIWSKQ